MSKNKDGSGPSHQSQSNEIKEENYSIFPPPDLNPDSIIPVLFFPYIFID